MSTAATVVKAQRVALNVAGRVIGEAHPRAVLTDHDVGLVLDLLEAGLSYSDVARKMGLSKSGVAHIATGRRRCQTPDRYAPATARARTGPKERKRGPKVVVAPPVNHAAVDLQEAINGCWR
ncbi:MAG: hypothetical protein RIS88_1691 [Pseudomonadota bacterium]